MSTQKWSRTSSSWYGKEAPLVVDFSEDGAVKIMMKDYIDEMLDE
jgi:hypothetical protein